MPRCCSFWGIQGTSQLPVTPGLAALLLGPWGPILATAGRNEPNLEPARFLSTAGARRQRTADKSCPRDEPRDSRRHCRGCEASKRQLENHTRPKLGWGRQICSWAARGGGGWQRCTHGCSAPITHPMAEQYPSSTSPPQRPFPPSCPCPILYIQIYLKFLSTVSTPLRCTSLSLIHI